MRWRFRLFIVFKSFFLFPFLCVYLKHHNHLHTSTDTRSLIIKPVHACTHPQPFPWCSGGGGAFAQWWTGLAFGSVSDKAESGEETLSTAVWNLRCMGKESNIGERFEEKEGEVRRRFFFGEAEECYLYQLSAEGEREEVWGVLARLCVCVIAAPEISFYHIIERPGLCGFGFIHLFRRDAQYRYFNSYCWNIFCYNRYNSRDYDCVCWLNNSTSVEDFIWFL